MTAVWALRLADRLHGYTDRRHGASRPVRSDGVVRGAERAAPDGVAEQAQLADAEQLEHDEEAGAPDHQRGTVATIARPGVA